MPKRLTYLAGSGAAPTSGHEPDAPKPRFLAMPAAGASRVTNISAWSVQVLLAFVFFGAGGAKIVGLPMMVEMFDFLRLGQWFRFATGLVEVAGAIFLLVPGCAFAAALWLACTMAGAVLAHVLILPTPSAPAVVLLVLCGVVAWLRRDQRSLPGGRR